MKLALSTKIKRNKNIIYKELEGVVYILDHRNATIHTLNEVASFIWKKTDKQISIGQLSALVCEKYDVGKKQAFRDIKKFISDYIGQEFLKII